MEPCSLADILHVIDPTPLKSHPSIRDMVVEIQVRVLKFDNRIGHLAVIDCRSCVARLLRVSVQEGNGTRSSGSRGVN